MNELNLMIMGDYYPQCNLRRWEYAGMNTQYSEILAQGLENEVHVAISNSLRICTKEAKNEDCGDICSLHLNH